MIFKKWDGHRSHGPSPGIVCPDGAHTGRLFTQHLLSRKTTDDGGNAKDDSISSFRLGVVSSEPKGAGGFATPLIPSKSL